MTTRCRLLFFVLLAAVSSQLPAQAKPERHYRVELMVLRHLDGISDTAPQETLRDLSAELDLYAPLIEDPDAKLETAGEQAALTDEFGMPLEPEEPEPPLAVRVDEMSDTMREAWRRMRLSAGFRPEQFRSWEQSGDSPFPTLRIHDEEVLFQQDPTLLIPEASLDEHGALVFSDATMDIQSIADDPGTEASEEKIEEELPPIEYFYRIDGTATLTRTRFLHLDLDIELREPLYETLSTPALEQQVKADALDEELVLPEGYKTGPAAAATSFRIHRIKQRRQVRTEQMEYFDGPVISVLAYITGFDVIPEENTPVASPTTSP